MLTLDGISYILSSTSRIRQDHRVGSESPKGIGCDFVIETIINPEDGQQLLVCKVRKIAPFGHVSLSVGAVYKSFNGLGGILLALRSYLDGGQQALGAPIDDDKTLVPRFRR